MQETQKKKKRQTRADRNRAVAPRAIHGEDRRPTQAP